jgi:hypothetical protein
MYSTRAQKVEEKRPFLLFFLSFSLLNQVLNSIQALEKLKQRIQLTNQGHKHKILQSQPPRPTKWLKAGALSPSKCSFLFSLEHSQNTLKHSQNTRKTFANILLSLVFSTSKNSSVIHSTSLRRKFCPNLSRGDNTTSQFGTSYIFFSL